MTTPDQDSGKRPPPRLVMAIVALLLVGAWFVFRMYTSADARTCAAAYNDARTSADTTRVDSLAPDPDRPLHSCGMIRTTARWQ